MAAVLETVQQDQPLSITLRLNEAQQARLRESNGLVVEAEACVVDCHDMALIAKGNLDKVIAFKKFLKAEKLDYVRPAKEIIAKAEAVYDAHIDAAERAETIYRKHLGDYQLAEQRRIEDLRKKQQEEERRIREDAERQAAAARARAEEQAREARRKADEAAAAEAKARAEGNARAAAAAAAERAKQEEAERQRREQAEREETRIRMEAAARQPATVVPEAQKVGGTRENWVVELDTGKVPDEDAAIALICEAIVNLGRRDLIALLDFDMSAAKKQAGSLKKLFNVPGYRVENRPGFVNTKSKG